MKEKTLNAPGLGRRGFLALAGAGAAAPLLPNVAFASSNGSTGQAPGFYRRKIGDVTVTFLNDGVAERGLDGFVANAPIEDVKETLQRSFLPTDKITLPFSATLIDTGSRKVLIDSGNGTFGAPTTGNLVANLKAAGVDPKDINSVIVSHFHPDHINGIRDKDGAPVFANAEITVPEAEWVFWMDDGRAAQAPEAMKGLFQIIKRVFEPEAKMVRRYKDGEELAPGLTAIATPGHTPGHMCFALASGSERMMIISDLANHPKLFVRRPDWSIMFDMDKPLAIESRKRILDMAAAEKMLLSGYHFPFPAHGYVAKESDGYAYVPAEWRPSV